MSFRNLKVGDQVTRILSGSIKMQMIVVAVTDKLIYCDVAEDRPMKGLSFWEHWKFNRNTGIEEEHDQLWGNHSILVEEHKEENV